MTRPRHLPPIRTIGLGIAAGALLTLTSGCAAPFYVAKSIHGRVIDAETKQPLPGTVVVAQWVLEQPFRGPAKRLNAEEAITDQNGDFNIPGWGPRCRPWYAELGSHDPWLLVFKAGYKPRSLYHERTRRSRWSMVRRSEFDGATIELERFQGTPKDRFRQLSVLTTGVYIAVQEGGYRFPALRGEVERDAQSSLVRQEWLLLKDEVERMTTESQ